MFALFGKQPLTSAGAQLGVARPSDVLIEIWILNATSDVFRIGT